MLYFLCSDISRSLPCLEPFPDSALQSGGVPRFLVQQSRTALPELPTPPASSSSSASTSPLPVSLSLSLPQPRAKNLQFFASSCYVLAQSVSSPTSFFYLTNEHFKRVTFTDPFSLKTPDWAVCPVPSSVTYSFTVEHCNVIVGLFVTFLHSLLSFLRTGILVLYIFVLTVPRYKSFQKK